MITLKILANGMTHCKINMIKSSCAIIVEVPNLLIQPLTIGQFRKLKGFSHEKIFTKRAYFSAVLDSQIKYLEIFWRL